MTGCLNLDQILPTFTKRHKLLLKLMKKVGLFCDWGGARMQPLLGGSVTVSRATTK
jgi:hypothetical protein